MVLVNKERRLLALMFVLVLSVPLTGAWYFAREYQAVSDVHPIDIIQLQTEPQTKVQQYRLDGFAIPFSDSVARGQFEYLCISPTKSGEPQLNDKLSENAPTIVLRRRVSREGTLRDRVTDGFVEGRIFPALALGKTTAEELQQNGATTLNAANCLIFEVDCDHLKQIFWNTATMTIYAVFVCTLMFGWFSRRYREDIRRQDRKRCELELQVKLAQQNSLQSSS